MPVRKDPSGRRFVQAEAIVPGTPEEVWQAIASGPGVSSWFVPTQMDGRVGGTVTLSFGPGMDSVAAITQWDPPRRFAADSQDMGPGGPTMATEWTVEARDGGTCAVRVVHSWFAATDDWDSQFEGHEHGWVAFFRILRLYLLHFRGEPSAALQLMGFTGNATPSAWSTLLDALGVSSPIEGQRLTTGGGAPSLSGVVERVGLPDHPELLLRIADPVPGLVHLFVIPMGGSTCVSVRVFAYGGHAAAWVRETEPACQAWMQETFPMEAATG